MSDIESHIATIGRALWARDGRGGGAGRATVMIGAGFSLNATPQAAGAHSFPMWKGLAKSLIDAIQPGCEYCNCLREDGTASGQARPTGCTRYERRLDLMERAAGTSGMMELGEKFEARKGAALLQGVLQRSVPDLEYGPGKPHQDLVRLPWADIFTTNWDTLLEQAVDAYDRSYELVVQPKQLATATAPRIVKLHGCVRSGTKKIFTEEDFRTYPAQYAPFVSLVQQSLMENVFVLIGFSGSDPNFKAWHGWVRDNLREHLQPAYLVTNKAPDSLDVSLFARRLISVVDLSQLGVGDDYGKMLEVFFQRLRDYRWEVRDNLKWPQSPNGSHDNRVAGTSEDWQTRISRRTPWLIVPRENRRELLGSLDNALGNSQEAQHPIETKRGPQIALEPALSTLFLGRERKADQNGQPGEETLHDYLLQPRERETTAIIVAEALKIGLARPRPKLLEVLREVFADMLLQLPWLTEPVRLEKDSYAQLLKLASLDDNKFFTEIKQRISASGPTKYRQAVMRLMPLFELVEREERWSCRTMHVRQLLQILSLVDPTPDGSELQRWASLQSSLDALEPAGAMQELREWTPRSNESVSMLRHAAGFREVGRIAEAELGTRLAVDLLRRLATGPRHRLADASRESWAFLIYSNLLEKEREVLKSIISGRHRGVTISELIAELSERMDELESRRCDPRRELDRLTREFSHEEVAMALRALKPAALPQGARNHLQWIVADPETSFLMLADTIGLDLAISREGKVLGLYAARLMAKKKQNYALTLALRAGNPADIPLDGETFKALFLEDADIFTSNNARAVINQALRLIAPSTGQIEGDDISYLGAKISLVLHLLCGIVDNDPRFLFFARALDVACRMHDSAIAEIGSTGWTGLILLFQRLVDAIIAPDSMVPENLALNMLLRLLKIAGPRLDQSQASSDPRGSDDWPDPFRILAWRKEGAEHFRVYSGAELRPAGMKLVALVRPALNASPEGKKAGEWLINMHDRIEGILKEITDEKRHLVLARRLAVIKGVLA